MAARKAAVTAADLERNVGLAADGTMSVEEASQFLGVSRTEVYCMIARGELKSIKLGKRRLLLRADLTRFLAGKLAAVGR